MRPHHQRTRRSECREWRRNQKCWCCGERRACRQDPDSSNGWDLQVMRGHPVTGTPPTSVVAGVRLCSWRFGGGVMRRWRGGWWGGVCLRGVGSRVVLVAVPPGWGRSTVLDHLAEVTGGDDGPVTLVARINGKALPDGTGLQAAVLRACLAEAGGRHRPGESLGLDRVAGAAQLGLGVGTLFVPGLAAGVSFLAAGLGVGAAGKAWDDSPAGQDGALARTARSVAAVSVSVPVVVIIDEADCVDLGR